MLQVQNKIDKVRSMLPIQYDSVSVNKLRTTSSSTLCGNKSEVYVVYISSQQVYAL